MWESGEIGLRGQAKKRRGFLEGSKGCYITRFESRLVEPGVSQGWWGGTRSDVFTVDEGQSMAYLDGE